MRYPKDQKDKTRQQILDTAAKVFRRKGFQGGSVDIVMNEAGLTAGGFYAHFASKNALFAEAIVGALEKGRVIYGKDSPGLEGAEKIRSVAEKYLSPGHRTHIEQGCVLPPLLADLPRQDEAVRRDFQDVLCKVAAALRLPSGTTGADTPSEGDPGWGVMAMLVGGMSLARAVADDELANDILSACRQLLDRALGEDASSASSAPVNPPSVSETSSASPTPAPSPRRKKRS